MKRILLFIGLLCLVASTFSQIKVSTSNNVGINTTNPLSKFSVNTEGYSNYIASFYQTGNEYLARFTLDNPTNSNYNLGLVSVVSNISIGSKNIAGYFSSYSSTTFSKRGFGVRAICGNGADGYNYGVLGMLLGSRDGAGIVGSINNEPTINGKYAGYFYGNVKIANGSLYVHTTQYTSDIRLKKDIVSLTSTLGETDNLDKIRSLNAIRYKFIDNSEILPIAVTDTMNIEVPDIEDTGSEHIGLSAQEIQLVYPELVEEDKNGYLSVDYIGLIPILIEATKEQQVLIEEMRKEIDALKNDLSKIQ